MKKTLLIILVVFGLATANAQVNIWSITFSPVDNSNDLQLNIRSYCNTVHFLKDYTITSNGFNHIINLCYTRTTLLMETDISNSITLTGLNAGSTQNFTINHYYHDIEENDCSNSTLSASYTFNLTTPLTAPRIFTLSTEQYNLKKTALFPNPNSGEFTLQLPTENGQAALTITDLSGKTVFTNPAYVSGDSIELKGLAKGLYFAKIIQNQNTEILKFIVK